MPKSKSVEGYAQKPKHLEPEEIGALCSQVVVKYTRPNINVRTMLTMEEFWRDITLALRGEEVDGLTPPPEVSIPTLVSLDPDTAEVGSDDITLRCIGTGFTEESVILWNEAEEPTNFVSSTEVTTGVKPSTASGPWTVSVSIRTGQEYTNPLHFAFTEPPEIVTLEDDDFDGEEVKPKKGKKGKG